MTKKRLFSKRNIAVLVILIVVGALIAWRASRDTEPAIRTHTVARQDVVQDVAFTGRLQSVKAAELGFAVGGTVTQIATQEGASVAPGTVLARLDSRTAGLDSAKARADRASAQAESRIASEKAEGDLTNLKAENTRALAEQKQVVRDKKAELDQALSTWETRAGDEGEDSYLAKVAYSAYLTARTAYRSAQETLATLEKTVAKNNQAAAEAARLAKEQHLATTQAAGGVAGLSSLQALEGRANVILSQYALVAPFAGTITDIGVETGEYATPGTGLITIQTLDQLEITADVPETDAFKLAAGQTATVTFEALPQQESWEATVTAIAPAARLIEGVPTYEVHLEIAMTDVDLKPGLTADVSVHADRQANALTAPRRALQEADGIYSVDIVGRDGATRRQEVTIGLTGSDGMVEIVSGLAEGDVIVLSRRDDGS